MLKYLLFFIVSPMIEFVIHKTLHRFGNTYHRHHHTLISKKENDNELWILYVLIPSLYCGTHYLSIGLIRYYIAHYIIHNHPHLAPDLTAHHIEHHKNPNINFAISATYPDRIFD